MTFLHDRDIDPSPLRGRMVTIIGFGNQGRAQALNLRDSGIDVCVGLREGSRSRDEAQAAGLHVAKPLDAAARADLVMLLAPDEHLPVIYQQIEPALRPAAALGFSHGLAIHYRLIAPRADLSVIMIAPKGPGNALRSLYQAGKGMVALAAVAQDPHANAWPLALAYGAAIGCARAGLLRSTFQEECVADLFNEAAVVWGAVPAVLQAGFDLLVEAGIQPEVAYLECIAELKLLADLVEARGLAGMREAISNTAELGSLEGGARVINDRVRAEMRSSLQELQQDDAFARRLLAESKAGYPQLRASRAEAQASMMEAVRLTLPDKAG
jgi:ketol-acid reductoisomerase